MSLNRAIETKIAIATKIAFSVDEAADSTSLSKAYIRKMIREGELKVTKCGTRVLILKEELERYLRERTG